jgi:hypothetical protein
MIGRLILTALLLLAITFTVNFAQPPPQAPPQADQVIDCEQIDVQGQAAVLFIDQQPTQASNAGAVQQVVVSREAPTTF